VKVLFLLGAAHIHTVVNGMSQNDYILGGALITTLGNAAGQDFCLISVGITCSVDPTTLPVPMHLTILVQSIAQRFDSLRLGG
jgi:hypothetical protein